MNRRQPKSSHARGARPWVTMILIAGFAVGISLSHTCRSISASPEKRIGKLIRDLEKQETSIDRFWHAMWRRLPGTAKDALAGLQPMRAATVRRLAAEQLRGRGEAARQAVPVLARALGDPDGQVQLAAIHALGSFGPVAQEAVPDLIDFCRAPKQAGVRGYLTYLVSQSALALADIAPTDPRVLAFMHEALNQPNPFDPAVPHLRSSAVPALEKIAMQTDSAIEMLLEAFSNSEMKEDAFARATDGPSQTSREATQEAAFRAKVVGALGRAGTKAPKTVLPALIRALNDRTPVVRFSAVEALGRMGPAAAPAVPVLIELARSRPHELESGTIQSLAQPISFSLSGTANVPTPPPYPTRDSRGLGQQIISTLGAIGPGAPAAIPFLMEQYTNETNPYRFDAAFARWRIDGRSEEIVPVLASGLNNADLFQRRRAARFLSRFGLEALPAFIEALDNEDAEVRMAAMRFCGRCGPAARDAVPKLVPALKDSRFSVRMTAERALKAIVPERAAEFKADPPPRTAFGRSPELPR